MATKKKSTTYYLGTYSGSLPEDGNGICADSDLEQLTLDENGSLTEALLEGEELWLWECKKIGKLIRGEAVKVVLD